MKKNKIQKIISISLILIFIISIINLNQKSYANITLHNCKGNITVSNVEHGTGIFLIQLAKMDFDFSAGQPKEGYNWTKAIQKWIDKNYPIYSDSENFYKNIESNSVEATKFYDEIISAIKRNDISTPAYDFKEVSGEKTYPIDESNLTGSLTFSNVDMGTYLITIENGYMVYESSVINVIPTYKDGDWTIEDQNIIAKGSIPTITKTVTDDTKIKDNYSTADEINYKIKADIPKYLENSLSNKIYISDKMDNSLNLKEDTLTVCGITDGNEAESIMGYNIKFDTKRPNSEENVTFLMDFDYDIIKKYKSIEITYKAKLSKDSNLNLEKNENNNLAYIDYSNNQYNEFGLQTQKSNQITVYTYGIELKVIDKEDADILLPGSIFEIHDGDGTFLKFIKGEDGIYYLAESREEGAITKLEVDSNGKLYIKGLDEGIYKITQVKAKERLLYSIKNI